MNQTIRDKVWEAAGEFVDRDGIIKCDAGEVLGAIIATLSEHADAIPYDRRLLADMARHPGKYRSDIIESQVQLMEAAARTNPGTPVASPPLKSGRVPARERAA